MSDPALEAAQRAMRRVHEYPNPNYDMKVAAYEALKPIQQWFDRNTGMSSITDNLLESLVPLIFPVDEEPDRGAEELTQIGPWTR